MKPLISVLMFLALSGCATLSKSQCVAANWQNIGIEDGRKGRPENDLEKHQMACGKHGIPVEKPNYLLGHNAGIKSYCTVKNALSHGMRGNEYSGVCPAKNVDDFLHAYVQGLITRLDSLHLKDRQLDLALFATQHRQSHLSNNKPQNHPQKIHLNGYSARISALKTAVKTYYLKRKNYNDGSIIGQSLRANSAGKNRHSDSKMI